MSRKLRKLKSVVHNFFGRHERWSSRLRTILHKSVKVWNGLSASVANG